MAKIGTYTYPDIRFNDAVGIARRILSKFQGVVSGKELAFELGMAENSGTLFAKIASLRDFGLVEGRGELRISDLGRQILHPATPEEEIQARIQAFQRMDLFRSLYERFNGEAPNDSSLLVWIEEITKAPRAEIVRRFGLIQKHLADMAKVMRQTDSPARSNVSLQSEMPGDPNKLYLVVGDARLWAPLTPEYIDAAINFLRAAKARMEMENAKEPAHSRS